MTVIKLIKHEGLNGRVWYRVYVNNSCEESFGNEDKAKEFYDLLVQRKKEGYPKSKTILSEEISDNYEKLITQ